MQYDDNCHNCPYYLQKHLPKMQHTNRESPPIQLEDNCCSTLLVFQAPGYAEWIVGKAIQPVKKKGGAAGVRIENSWLRKKKLRENFNIINAVQCFPGNDGGRDFIPNSMAVCSCFKRLKCVLESKDYVKIIVFGRIAKEMVDALAKNVNYSPQIIQAPHPNSGVKNAMLDALW